MTDFAPALARLQLALDQSAALQDGLRRRQGELLSLEDSVADVGAGRIGTLVLIDQAEDVRRAMRSHADLEIPDARDALVYTRGALIDALMEHGIPPDTGRLLIHVVDRAAGEGERGAAALGSAADALASTSRASSKQPDLLQVARQSIDTAAAQLESARRAMFRVAEDLPILVDSVSDVAVAAGMSLDLAGAPTWSQTERGMTGAERERRHPPMPSAGVNSPGVQR